MKCFYPRTVGFSADGKTIVWSQKQRSKEYAEFQLPCSKCLACRLEYARSWAVRCVHESLMHENNSFITLTYSDEYLGDGRLHYRDFQLFMKKLRRKCDQKIGVFVTGEYGEKFQRPHWHACVFGYRPKDAEYKYSNDRGDRVYSSTSLTELWGQGVVDFGEVTFESAGYCARYAAKKLIHGRDQEHDFHPISKKSSKQAIGKSWLEKFWPDAFNRGNILLPNGQSSAIPRYYEKWLKEKHPDAFYRYLINKKLTKQSDAIENSAEEFSKWMNELILFRDRGVQFDPITRAEVDRTILDLNFKKLQENLKL